MKCTRPSCLPLFNCTNLYCLKFTSKLANSEHLVAVTCLISAEGSISHITHKSRAVGNMRVPRYLRLLTRPPALDFEEASWELWYLLRSPRHAYKSLNYRQQTKTQWARDDPSFVILLSSLIAISALAWGIAYSPSVLGVLRLMLYMVVVDFLVTGVVISSIAYVFTNKVLRKPSQHSEAPLEWAYCFDVHCNSFFVVFLWLYILQFLILPVVNRTNWLSVIIGNTLYFASFAHYSVITFLGYSMLPFLTRTQTFFYPVIPAFIIYVVACISKWSMVRFMSDQYFN